MTKWVLKASHQTETCAHIIQLLLSVLLHAANVVHRQVDPPVDPAEQLPVEVGEDALLHLDGRTEQEHKTKTSDIGHQRATCIPKCPSCTWEKAGGPYLLNDVLQLAGDGKNLGLHRDELVGAHVRTRAVLSKLLLSNE